MRFIDAAVDRPFGAAGFFAAVRGICTSKGSTPEDQWFDTVS